MAKLKTEFIEEGFITVDYLFELEVEEDSGNESIE